MGFAEKEQQRKTRSVVSSIAGMEEKELDSDVIVKRGRPKEKRETKKRISLAVYPSIYDGIAKIAYVDRQTISEVIGKCLEEYVKQNQDKIEEYDHLQK